MVLWEITLGTAYFLGLKRTYKLALLLQRRIVGPQHPRLRQFIHRRFRAVFEMAVKVHQSIEQRDIEIGKNLGNWIIRWMDPAREAGQLRPTLPMIPASTNHPIKHVAGSNKPLGIVSRNARRATENWNKGRLFFAIIRPKSLPRISMMIQSMRPAGINNIQYRYASNYATDYPMVNCSQNRFEGVFRKDIAQWMMR